MSSDSKNHNAGVALGIAIGFALQILGYFLVRGDQTQFGSAMFVLVPFVSGFAVAAKVRKPKRVAACCLTSGILTFSVLLFTGLEGIICCAMSLPLVMAGTAMGAVIGYWVRGRFIDQLPDPGKTTLLMLLACPFIIAAGDGVERSLTSSAQKEVFTTEITVAASPDKIWDLVAQMHQLDGPRPFLLRVGLPVPYRCTLNKAAIGGRRICYFNKGVIEQEVTDWQRPSYMGLRITKNTLPGRHWLTFVDASYELTARSGQTRIIRHSTIATRLSPRWYWRPLERWGVTSEHAFVFSNLERWTQQKK